MSLVIGDGVLDWVNKQLSVNLGEGAGIGFTRNGEIIMGSVFNNYNTASIHMHIALKEGERLSPTFVAAIMDYPFRQLGVKRITGLIAETNIASRRFAEHLGFKFEGLLQDAIPSGNLVMYGLLKEQGDHWLTALYQRRLKPTGL